MDEALLRRLLGAAALLGLAFLLATLLPDPTPAERTNGAIVAYDLRTGERIGKPVAPQPPVEHPPALKPEEKLEQRPTVPAPAAAPLPRPALKVDETLGKQGGWFVQVGSYSNQANARNALQKLFGMGLPTVIQSVAVGKTLWYRVRVGPYPGEGAALAALASVKKNGYSTAKLVRPDPDAAPKGN
jgi:cell division protein FtsN